MMEKASPSINALPSLELKRISSVPPALPSLLLPFLRLFSDIYFDKDGLGAIGGPFGQRRRRNFERRHCSPFHDDLP